MADVIGRGIIEVVGDASGLTAAMQQAEASVEKFEAAAVGSAGRAGSALASGQAQATAATTQLDATTKRFLNTLERESLQAGRTRAEYLELRAAKLGVSNSAAPLISRIREAERGVANLGLSSKQTTAALRGVPAQITDIVTSLQGGQNPLTVFLQQGGQLRDMFGGAAPAARALGGAVLSLINPFTIAAAAAGALGFAYVRTSQESSGFARALILSGNAAGATVDQLQTMAASIDAIAGTQSLASEALSQFAATGQVGAANLERFTLAAIRLERVAGVAVADTVKQFAELGKSPSEAARKLNEQYRFLTSSVYEQIRALEEQGRTTEAANLAQETFANTLTSRSDQIQQRLGFIERSWIAIKDAIKEAGDELLSFGRQDTTSGQIATLQAQLEQAEQSSLLSAEFGGGDNSEYIASLKQQIALLQQTQTESANAAQAERQRAIDTEASIKAQDAVEKIRRDSASKQEKLNKALEDYRKNIEAIRKADPNSAFLDPAKIKRDEAAIRERFRDKSGDSAAKAERRSLVDFDLSKIKQELDSLTGSYKNAESILEATRSAGLLSEREYYDAKASFIRLNEQAQIGALTSENARLAQEKVTGKERIDNQRKIAENEAKIAAIRANASAQIELLGIREQSSLASIARGYQEARIAAEQFLATQNLAQTRAVDSLGQGQRTRDRESGRNQIIDRYQGQRDQLEANKQLLEFEGRFTEESRAQYEQRLALINEFQQKALESYNAYYDTILQREMDFSVGASEAVNNYLDNAKNVAAQTEQLFTNAFRGMEDALVSFIQTGKLDFKSLADSIVADILRIIVQQQLANAVASASSYFGGGGGGFVGQVFGALLGSGARANGGPVEANQPYMVGEYGRELFVPRTAGTVVSAAQTQMATKPQRVLSVTNNFTVNGQTSRTSQQQIAAEAARAIASADARFN